MALLPNYGDIGVWASVLLSVCRLVQGFSFGGEVGPLIADLTELATAGRRGLFCAAVFAGKGATYCAAGIIGTVLSG